MRIASQAAVAATAVFCAAAVTPVGAQVQVYKCGYRSYSEVACSNHRINTSDAPVPRPAAGSQLLAMRRLPGESSPDFTVRRHRARMLETDRDECARLDTRIPFEAERLKSPHAEEVEDAQSALTSSKQRFRALRC